ncbi:hypothetical protein [Nocardioides dongkuii]|uniref:hypothetical protein n=1 Tax=Nocardioides dongkuii TaxID=2760089 RepID=UPI0018783E7F|nr:hypothetical protein [Nocardioides dongkuii]
MTAWLFATGDPADRVDPVRTPVRVVTLADGRLGFAVTAAGEPCRRVTDGATVTLEPPSGPADMVTGTAAVVRSGRWYDEVRGRLRAEGTLLERWRLRRADAVVLVTPAGAQPTGD